MPSKQEKIWSAKPHTLAKNELLSDYLFRWFQILGMTSAATGLDLVYIDGFAGPGEYTNHSKGSPLLALIAAKKARTESRTAWRAGMIHCIFIEADRQRFKNLQDRIRPFEDWPEVKIHLANKRFVAGLETMRESMPFLLNGINPVFVFIDPFGTKGVPFATVKSILNTMYSEVLINLDADGIVRIVEANDGIHEELLNEVFGDDQWKQIPRNASFSQKCQKILELYKDKLRAEARYIYSFEMRTSQRLINYYLVFAGNHPRGLEKMKESMKKIDQDGSYRFTDSSVGQMAMSLEDQMPIYAEKMRDFFSGQAVTYQIINDYALNETPYVNPKAMLKYLEGKGLLFVSSVAPRPKGTFNEQKISSIQFGTETI